MNTEVASSRRVPWSARVPLAIALGVLVFSLVTIVRWTGPAVALTYRWEPGQVIRDHFSMEMAVRTRPSILEEDVEMKIEMTEVTRVVAVDDQGNATLEIYGEDVEVEGSAALGPTQDVTAEMKRVETLVMSPDGRILESSNPLLDPAFLGDQSFMTEPLLPDGPVAPGDTWEQDYFWELGFGEGGFDLSSENELVRYDEVNDIETVVVRQQLFGPFEITFSPSDLPPELLPQGNALPSTDLEGMGDFGYTGEIAMDGDSWVDPLTGDILRSQGEGSIFMSFELDEVNVPMFGMEIDMDIETQRLP